MLDHEAEQAGSLTWLRIPYTFWRAGMLDHEAEQAGSLTWLRIPYTFGELVCLITKRSRYVTIARSRANDNPELAAVRGGASIGERDSR
eukprot:COSAG01_NODE_33_length_35013_cov_86.824144_17_plen_89_part_00